MNIPVQIVHEIKIGMTEQGKLLWSFPDDLVLALGMIEAAKMQMIERLMAKGYGLKPVERKPDIMIVPSGSIPPSSQKS